MQASRQRDTPIESTLDTCRAGPVPRYRFFDICLSSEVPLPELAPCPQGAVQVQVQVASDLSLDSTGFTTCHTWRSPDGAVICHSLRRASEYILWLPGQAGFLIDHRATTIGCFPEPGVDTGLLRQLLLNQVLPRYLAHAGLMLLHASAVSLPDGRTVAFLGQSGAGKSTLASYCRANGAQIIDDDCILVRFDDENPCIIGGVPTIRLYQDSLAALGHSSEDFIPYTASSQKRQMNLPAGSVPGPEPRKLDALYLLTLPAGNVIAHDQVCIESATGSEAMMAIMSCAFSLDPSDADTMGRIFAQAGQLLTAVPDMTLSHLQYPREHDKLPLVLDALLDLPSI